MLVTLQATSPASLSTASAGLVFKGGNRAPLNVTSIRLLICSPNGLVPEAVAKFEAAAPCRSRFCSAPLILSRLPNRARQQAVFWRILQLPPPVLIRTLVLSVRGQRACRSAPAQARRYVGCRNHAWRLQPPTPAAAYRSRPRAGLPELP